MALFVPHIRLHAEVSIQTVDDFHNIGIQLAFWGKPVHAKLKPWLKTQPDRNYNFVSYAFNSIFSKNIHDDAPSH